MLPTFGYWWVRALGQPIRFLLAYLKIKHNSKVYTKPEDWFNHDKTALQLQLPNLPYYIDGDVKLTETAAIPVYLIKKQNRHDLLGQNSDGSFNYNEVKVQQLIGFFRDVFIQFNNNLCQKAEFDIVKEKIFAEKLKPMLNRVENILGDQDFLCGELTYADFWFYEMLNYYKYIFPQTITPTLTSYLNRFENLPGIKEYLAEPEINLNDFLPGLFCYWTGPKQN